MLQKNKILGKNIITSFISLIIPVILIIGCIVVYSGANTLVFIFSVFFPILFFLNLLLIPILIVKKNKSIIFPILGLILFFLCFNSFFQWNSNSNLNSINSLSVITYNTQNFEPDVVNEEKIIDFIKEKQADIVLFQEFDAIKYHKFRKDYDHYVKTNRMSPGKSVLAIFSKYPIKEKGVVEFPNSINNAVYVDVLYNKQKIRIYNLHLESFKFKREIIEAFSLGILNRNLNEVQSKQKEQAEIILNHTKNFSGKILICGDFNSTQFSPAYLELKKGRKDSFIESGNGFGTTYKLKWYPLRLDYVLVDSEIEVISHKNFEFGYSDHEPVFVELNIN